MIRKLNAPADSDTEQDYEWEPALTLSHAVQRGLEYPRRAFTLYLDATPSDIDQAILSFTTDDQLVLGLSIDDEGATPETLERAKELLFLLVEQYDCHRGLILVEQPPPDREQLFDQNLHSPHPLCQYAWARPIHDN